MVFQGRLNGGYMKEWEFYVDGKGFNTYQEARTYADEILITENKYRCIFTKSEMDSVNTFIQQGKEYKE
jgi:hypothetical protein